MTLRTLGLAIVMLLAIPLSTKCLAEENQDSPQKDDAADAPKKVILCKEHGVPQDICCLCNPKLAKDFKKKGDWCKEHKIPESQCFQCNPGLEAKFKAWAAAKKVEDDDKKDNEIKAVKPS